MPYENKAAKDLTLLSNPELGDLLGTVMETIQSLNYPGGPPLVGYLLATIRDRLIDPASIESLVKLIDRKSGKETLVGLIDILGYEIKDNELVAKPKGNIFDRLPGYEVIEGPEGGPEGKDVPPSKLSGEYVDLKGNPPIQSTIGSDLPQHEDKPDVEVGSGPNNETVAISEERQEYINSRLGELEREAKEVYDNWNRSGELDPWVDGRRSVMQCKARGLVLAGKHGHEKVSADLAQLYKIRTTPSPDINVIGEGPEHLIEDDLIEAEAEVIYNSWSTRPGFIPWVKGGNSINQEDARRRAREELEKKGLIRKPE